MADPHDTARDEMMNETIMAFVDGELPPHEAARVRQMLCDDAALAARAELFSRSRKVLSQSPLAAVPTVDPVLIARVRSIADRTARPEVLPFRRPALPWVPMALAASLALIVGGVAGYGLGERTTAPIVQAGADDGGPWRQALAAVPSGESRQTAAGRLTAIASFHDGAGRLCREVELAPEIGAPSTQVLCRADDGWHLELRLVGGGGGGYAAASSHGVVDAFLAARNASAPLSPDAERRALEALR
ncbi:anti-sigma factor family protein [Xanthobacteraceae bacterium A53D]